TGTNGPCEFCQYYIHNGNGGQSPYNGSNFYIQPDGFTTVIQAYSAVQCGETYHIKIAIADAGDSSFNSYVFLEAASFSSNSLQLAFEAPELAPTDTSVYEGCSFGSLTFTRPGSQSDVEGVFDILVGGTAINGTDYSYIPDSLVFAIGETEVELPIEAFSDLEEEGLESIEIIILSGIACVSSDTAAFTLWIEEIPPLTSTISNVEINCGDSVLLSPDIVGGIGVYEVQWSTGEIGHSIYVDPVTETTYFYTVFDTCNVTPSFGTVTVTLPEYPPLIADAGPDIEISCLTDLYAEGTGEGGYGNYDYQWIYNGSVVSLEEIVQMETVPNEGAFTLEISDACNTIATDSFEVTFPDETILIDIGDDQDVTCLSQVTITADVSGGIGTYSYEWQVDGVVEDDDPTLVVSSVTQATNVQLTITDECGNVETQQIEINVIPTGLNIELGPDVNVDCLDLTTINPDVFGGIGDLNFEWTVAGNVESTSPILTWQTDTDVIVSLSVTDQCGFSDSDFMELDFSQVPINLNITPSQIICPGDEVELEVIANGGAGDLSYDWNPGTGTGTSIDVSPSEETTYSVQVSDECGSVAG
ncbi:MAG: choice-of-anchor L domain-containing protein, partial [Flavobacteriales bacterium]|nr:choice-of-anchor L domain-containing protein [Flavobacteriales bacterium]